MTVVENLLPAAALDNGFADGFTGCKKYLRHIPQERDFASLRIKKTPTLWSGLLPDQARVILSCKK